MLEATESGTGPFVGRRALSWALESCQEVCKGHSRPTQNRRLFPTEQCRLPVVDRARGLSVSGKLQTPCEDSVLWTGCRSAACRSWGLLEGRAPRPQLACAGVSHAVLEPGPPVSSQVSAEAPVSQDAQACRTGG